MAKRFLITLGSLLSASLLFIITANYVIDTQNVFHHQESDAYDKYAQLTLDSKYGVFGPPVNGTVLKYAMMQIVKPDCVLYGSSHVAPATQDEMPTIFGDCKKFLNVWATGGGAISGAIFAQLAVKQKVRKFVYEISPHWYYFDNLPQWVDKPLLAKEALSWADSDNSGAQVVDALKYSFNERVAKLEVLINWEYLKRNIDSFISANYVLPDRSIANLDSIKIEYVPSADFRDHEQTITKPDGAIVFSDIHVDRPTTLGCRNFPHDDKLGWALTEKTLKKLKDAGIDTEIMLIPAHPILLNGCPNYRADFHAFYDRLSAIAHKLDIPIHGSFFPEDLGNPDDVAQYIKFDGHHINKKEGFKFIK